MAGNEASQFQRVLNEVRSERLVEIASAICNAHSPTGGEADVARVVKSYMEQVGLRASLQEVEDNRFNVIGILDGAGKGRTLMFNGHMDTSYPFMLGGSGRTGMLDRPLLSKVVGDWLYGTGIDNMKSALACYIGAIEALQRSGTRLAGDIIVAGVVGEVGGVQ